MNVCLTLKPRAVRTVLIALPTALALVAATAALGAAPLKSALYTGHGRECMNDTRDGRYTVCMPGRKVTLRVSPDGRNVERFVGAYDFYCGGGWSTVVATTVPIKRDGRFAAAGSWASRLPNGRRNGTNHAVIDGRFTGNGRTATVHFRWTVQFSNSSARPCGTDVRLTLHAR
jgi:hypothetical protein